MSTLPVPSNQGRKILRDATVLSLTPVTEPAGTAGTAVSYLGVIDTVKIGFKREYADVTGSTDMGPSRRPVRWGQGSCEMSGFPDDPSPFMTLFAGGGHAVLQFTEKSSADSYIVVVDLEEYSKSMGKSDPNKDTITLPTEGVPFYGAAGASPEAMNLE